MAEISFDKNDIIAFMNDAGYSTDKVSKYLSIGKYISLKVSIVTVSIELSVVDANLCLNIKSANVLGMSLFGAVRQKAGNIIIEMINSNPNKLKAHKNKEGNIEIYVPGVEFNSVEIFNETVNINLEFTSL